MNSTAPIMEQIRRRLTPEAYQEIFHEWKIHSVAEDKRDIPGLMSTLTEECVYEILQTGHRWERKEGATRFYEGMLAAFPDIHFDLQNIVVGPQGVFEEALVTGTFQADWLTLPATGQPVKFTVLILFPWDPQRKKFSGERIYLDVDEVLGKR